MPKVNVNPEELYSFAQNLALFNEELKQNLLKLNNQFKQLSITWHDQEYQEFAQEYMYTIKAINHFINAIEQYIKFLLRKSGRANLYFKEVIKSIRVGFKEGQHYSLQMMQGKAGERVTMTSGNYYLLDDIVDKLASSTPGGHFKIYDNIGENIVGSVKVRGIKYDTSVESIKTYISAYINDFLLTIGYVQDKKALRFESAVELLLEAKEKQHLPHRVYYGKRRQLPEFINTIAQEVEQRIKHEEESLQRKPTIFLVVYGLQRARDLEQDESFGSGFSFDMTNSDIPKPPDPSKQFPKILKEGPDLGVHTIIWCDTNKSRVDKKNRPTIKKRR
jgi:uncharacterized protein YukE